MYVTWSYVQKLYKTLSGNPRLKNSVISGWPLWTQLSEWTMRVFQRKHWKDLYKAKSPKSVHAFSHTPVLSKEIYPVEIAIICQKPMQTVLHFSIIYLGKSCNDWNDHHSFWSVHTTEYIVSFYKMWQKYINRKICSGYTVKVQILIGK